MTGLFDVIVVGGGVVGLAIARELSRYQLSIAVAEQCPDVAMGVTKANSAIVHGGYAESHKKLKGRLCYQGRREYARLEEELHFGFDPIGSLVLAFEEEQRRELEALMENGRKNGVPDLELWDRKKILEREPLVNPDVKYALYCAGAGVCSPYEFAIALAENAIANGMKLLLNTKVTAISKEEDGIFTLSTTSGVYRARYVVNAAGLGSEEVSRMAAQTDFQIVPRSGEYLLFGRDTGKKFHHVLFQMPTKMGKGILVTRTYHGNLLLGPDAVDERGQSDTSTHGERLLRIYQEATLTSDQLDIRQFLRSFTGLRPVSTTDDFIIEETSTLGFINVAGIQSPGLTSSPAIAKMVRDILSDAGLSLREKEDFCPERKPVIHRKEMRPVQEILPLVDLPSCPEKIICRCEQVTEGEIVDCLHRGIQVTTVDGVKRRTRASMGWCQGTFCRPRIKAIIEREYGIDISGEEDFVHSGVNRVGKNEITALIQAMEAEKNR